MNVLVDTNVISELKRDRNADQHVMAWYEKTPVEWLFTSVVVLGELRRGIELIARRDHPQAAKLELWYVSLRAQLSDRVLTVDEPVMNVWARISVPDRLPTYDGLIAATALVHNMAVASRDVHAYRRVGLSVINPWDKQT